MDVCPKHYCWPTSFDPYWQLKMTTRIRKVSHTTSQKTRIWEEDASSIISDKTNKNLWFGLKKITTSFFYCRTLSLVILFDFDTALTTLIERYFYMFLYFYMFKQYSSHHYTIYYIAYTLIHIVRIYVASFDAYFTRSKREFLKLFEKCGPCIFFFPEISSHL